MDTQQHQAAASPDGAEAAAALAEIQRMQERVIDGVLVPIWYWWVMAAAIVVIGIARDSGDSLVQAIVIPLAALVIVGLIGAAIPEVRRRVQVHGATQPDPRLVVAIIALIVAVDVVIVGTAASLAAAHDPYPVTIGSAAGAVVMVIAGPLLTRYTRRLMLSQARRQASDAASAGGLR